MARLQDPTWVSDVVIRIDGLCWQLRFDVYKNKKNERGIVVRNKARLVAQGHRQEEGIDYDEVFALVARIEAIMIFLAFASFMGFVVYQMDVKSAFLYGTIEEEVYVSQPPSFIDPQFPNKVYKVKNALYGLHQAPRAWFQVTPKLSHFHVVRRIFMYLKGQPKLGLWYPTDSPFNLEAYSDSDYARANLDRNLQQENSATSQTINDEKQIHAIVDGKTVVITRSSVRRDLLFTDADGITSLTTEHIFENLLLMGLVRAATTASLDAQQDSSNITKTQSKATLNEPTPQGEGSGSGLGRQETIGGYAVGSGEDKMEHDIKLTDYVLQLPHDSPLSRGHTPRSDKGSLTLKAKKIASMKKRVTKLEQRQSSRILCFHPFRAGTSKRDSLGRRKVSKQGRKNLKSQQMFQDIDDVLDEDADTEIIVEDKGNGEKRGSTVETVSIGTLDISAARPEVSTAEPKTLPTTATLFDDEDATIADTLIITTLQPLPTIDPKDKGKGILQEPEPMKKPGKKRQEEASKAALAEMYDEVQAQIDVNHELAVRLTHEEQEKYTVEEMSNLLAEFFERRKKQLAKERAKAIRSKPPTKTQLRYLMMTYLKHTGSKEDEKRIGSRKKRATCLSSKHKSPRKQKVNDQESEDSDKEHRKCLKVVPDDDKAIDYETLDVKSQIVDCESQVLGTNEAGDVHVYKLTRLDGSYRHLLTFSRILEVLDRQDVLDLHKIIIERFPANDPKGYDLILWGDLKTLVESKKRYPLTKEILKKMLSSRLEAETERNENNTRFWLDIWKGDSTLWEDLPRIPVRGGIELSQFNDLVLYIGSVSLSSSQDRWVCNASGDGIFRVKDIRNSIDDLVLPSWPKPTRWVKLIPIKINVFIWRAHRDCLPTRVNLIRRGVVKESTNFPICGLHEEDAHLIFFQCDLAQAVHRRICRWWELDWQFCSSFSSWNVWFASIRLVSNIKGILEGVFYVAWWSIWAFRNRILFDDKPPASSTIIDDIMSLSFHWCKNRCKWTFSWEAWIKNPHLISL
nr:RNA-directed DNA polymerase, eukaryota [Tanacetum cinerariifolium]